MQQYDLPKEQPFEDLLTCPIMIDGRGINQRLREQRREWIRRQRAQELSIKRFIIKWLGRGFKVLYKLIYAYCKVAIVVLGWVYDKAPKLYYRVIRARIGGVSAKHMNHAPPRHR